MRRSFVVPSILLSCILRAQLVAPQLKTITMRDGLSSDHVMALEVDPLGCLWVGTANGLNRFNGRSISTFSASRMPNALPGDKITAIASDGHRFLYIGTTSAYLTILDTYEDTITNIKLPVPEFSQHGEQRVNDAHIDRRGRIWLAHGARCLSRFDPTTKRFTTYEVPPAGPDPREREMVHEIDEDKSGVLWLSLYRGMARFDPERGSTTPVMLHAPGLPHLHPNVRGVMDDDSCLVIGTWGEGIFRVRRSDGAARRIWPQGDHKVTFTDHAVQDILRMDQHHALVATVDMGVLQLDLRDGTMQHYDRSLHAKDCREREDLLVGASRLLRLGELIFIGSYTQGAAIWSPQREAIIGAHLPDHDPSEMNDDVLDIGRDAITGDVLALAHRHGLFVYDGTPALKAHIEQDASAPLRRYLSMEQLSGREWLVAGMPRWATARPTKGDAVPPAFRMDRTPCGEGIWWARADGRGGLWCLTAGYELYHADTNAMTCTALKDTRPQVASLISTWPYDVFVDASQRTWFLSANTPPVVLHPDGRAEKLTAPASLAPFEVSDIAQGPDGRIWLAVKHTGLARVTTDAEGRISITDESGPLRSRNIIELAAMTNGSLWMSLPNALQCWSPGDGTCKMLTVADGLPSGALHLGRSQGPQTPPMVVGATEGWFAIREDALRPVAPPAVQIPAVLVGDSMVRRHADRMDGLSLTLPYHLDRLTMRLRSTNLFDPQRDEFSYRLIGSDTAWALAGTDDRITFNSLPPGSFRFEARARTDKGPWGAITAFSVVVLPPFWSTWWFRLLAAILLLASAWGMFRIVLRSRLRKQQQRMERERAVLEERIRIAHDLHDDLGSSLASIGMESELAELAASDPTARAALRRVSLGARNVGDNMRRIVWAMSSGQDTLGDLIAYVRGVAGELVDPTDAFLDVEQHISTPDHTLTLEQRKHLTLFCKEALHNVARHSGATRVVLRFIQNTGSLQLTIEDNGRGFDPTASPGTGTASLRERAVALDAAMNIRSAPGEGTTIDLQVPLDGL